MDERLKTQVSQVCCTYLKRVPVMMEQIESKLRALYSDALLCKLGRIVVVGGGENYPAVTCAKEIFSALTPWPKSWIDCVTPMDMTYFYPKEDLAFGTSLIILLDMDGESVGMEKVCQLAKKAGAHTLLVTGEHRPSYSKNCTRILQLDSAEEDSVYIKELLVMMLLGIRMGHAMTLYSAKQGDEYRREILHYTGVCMDRIPKIVEQANRHAVMTRDVRDIELVSSEYDKGSCWLSRSILSDMLQIGTGMEESQNWLHTGGDELRPGDRGTVLFISADDPAVHTGLRTLRFMEALGRWVFVVTDKEQSCFTGSAEVVSLPRATQPWISLLYRFLPVVAYSHCALEHRMLSAVV